MDTTVEVDVIADTTQGSSKSSYPLGNHTRSITEKTTQPTLEKCQQAMQVLKKRTQLKTKITKILILILKKLRV